MKECNSKYIINGCAEDLVEILADIEHQRWSNWQSHLHSLCIKNDDGSLTIPKEKVEVYKYEINTDYKDLPNDLQEYDRKEVIQTLKGINTFCIKNHRIVPFIFKKVDDLKTVLNILEKKDKIIDEMADCINNYQICDYEITDYEYRKCEYIADDEKPPCKECIKEYFRKKIENE